MKSWYEDNFKDYNTTTLLGLKQPTNLEKERIFKVLTYISATKTPNIAIPHSNEFHNLIVETSKIPNKSLVEKYDILKSKIEGCETNECLLIHVAKTYGLTPKSLLMDTIAIHSRIKKLESNTTWFDNYSLNSFLLQLTTIIYSEFDNSNDDFVKSVEFNKSKNVNTNMTGGKIEEDEETYLRKMIYEIETNKKIENLTGGLTPKDVKEDVKNLDKINKNVKLTNPKELLFHLGNNYRCFFEFGKPADEIKDNDKAVEMLDKLVLKYPYFTGCAHGCDVFTSDFRDKSVGIADIAEFCERYPYSIVGYILNTKTYKSGRGQHWVALLFKFKTCYLICSERSDFNAFEEKTLVTDIDKNGFSRVHNTQKIQTDSSSCGMFSVLANACFVIKASGTTEPNIVEIVDKIGINGTGINKSGNIFEIKGKLAGYENEKDNKKMEELSK